MKHTVYFRNSAHEEREIGSVNLEDNHQNRVEKAVFKMMKKFCDDRNFRIFYYRFWNRDGETWFDVGSHTEFFLVRPAIPLDESE